MNSQLIPVVSRPVGNDTIPTVDARKLHEFLGSKQDFTSWMKVQIDRARLVENRDFVVFTKKGVNLSGGRPTAEYHLTIDAGKHVAMMSNTEKGFEVRDYFLECERRATAVTSPQIPQSFADALKLAYEQQLVIEEKTKLLEIAQPKIEFYEAVTGSADAVDIGTVAKVLNMGLGRTRLFALLRAKGVLMNTNQPYQEQVDAGRFRIIEQKYNKPDGSTCINFKTVVYQKGIEFIRKLIIADKQVMA